LGKHVVEYEMIEWRFGSGRAIDCRDDEIAQPYYRKAAVA
jgi:hypothetical protein